MTQKNKKIQSVLELGQYSVGETVYWVTLRTVKDYPQIPVDQRWMLDTHPKTIYKRGVWKEVWGSKKLPKLHSEDFPFIVKLLNTKFTVEEFRIIDVVRTDDIGEYYYCNEDSDWMPEEYLFDTITAARREKSRLTRLIKKWADN